MHVLLQQIWKLLIALIAEEVTLFKQDGISGSELASILIDIQGIKTLLLHL